MTLSAQIQIAEMYGFDCVELYFNSQGMLVAVFENMGEYERVRL